MFRENCSACHGENAAGREKLGPPLVHRIYEPGHHGDGAFFLAVQQGVRAHHWPFGNMPPVAGVPHNDVENIIVYVRRLQQANGIN
ncbi:c-type cytochrome [Roseibium sp. Sym1]|uniref:c-type cytochrome n=1 Tax=Roseibium sp. Sym1 TaxID=3016006 RepID=UPI0022B4C358|nr:cytochrome c [Roseibium sp. Sym1]